MPVGFKPTSVIKARLGIEPNGKVQRFFTHACRIHMDKYVPFDTGTLADTAYEGANYIIYQTSYAKIVYFGVRDGKEINYHLDKHPLAGKFWDKRMVSAEIDDVMSEVHDYMKRSIKK